MKRPWQYITRLKVSHYNCRPHCMPDLQVTRRMSSLACPTLLHVPKPLKMSQDMPCPQTRHRWTACCGTCWMSDGPAGMCMHPAATPRHHTSWDIGHLRHDFGHIAFSQSDSYCVLTSIACHNMSVAARNTRFAQLLPNLPAVLGYLLYQMCGYMGLHRPGLVLPRSAYALGSCISFAIN